MIARAVFSRRVFSRRESTTPCFHILGVSLALLLLALLTGSAAGAQQTTKKWSLGLTFMDLSEDSHLGSTGTAQPGSTPETVAFASVDVAGTDFLGMGLGFRPTRLFGVQLSVTRLGERPASFRAVCDPCEIVTTDPVTGESTFHGVTFDNATEADLDTALYLLDLSFFPPLSRYSSSDGPKFEVFLGPTLAEADTSLESTGGLLSGVRADIEVENSLGAHLGLAFHPAPAWTIHATARWIPTVLALDYKTRAELPAAQGILTFHAPVEPAESDWITVGLGFDWRF